MTSPITRIAELIERHVGLKKTRVESVARELQLAGTLPKGAPGRAPEFERADAITLLIAVATGAKLEDVTEATRAALATTPGGANVDCAPLRIPRTAEIQLAVLAGMAAEGDTLDEVTLEVAHGWPEITLAWADGITHRFQAAGSVPNHQPSNKARIATTIPGSAFAAFIKEADHG